MLQKIINLGICLVILSLPLYLIRLRIGWIPTNLLELMICGLFIIWLVSKIRTNPGQFKKANFFFPVFLIFLGATLATLFSVDVITSAGIWKGWFVVPLVFFIVIADSLKTKKQVRDILFALFLSGTGVAFVALYYWLNNNLTYDGRLRAFYLSPNHLAMYLSPILILSFYLYSSFKKNIHKIILFIVHCSLFIVIYLTYSYGAWLGVIGALIFISFSRVFKRKFIYLTIFLVLLVALFFSWQNFSYPSWQSRLIIWQSAGTIIKDHSLIGIGPGMFQKYYLDYQAKFPPYLEWAVPQPHNLFLAFWLQTGLLGLIGFIWLLVIFFRQGMRLRILNTKYLILNTFLMAAMIYILIHGLVDTTYWKNDLAIIFWLLIALNYKASRLAD
ncbi:MAG: O-antigen ligase family protein [Candidatus Portnoybacteria bacterium]|nr:O-antigen ligase family protein [Candidatus Portnoybacteria bacterium]